MPVLATFCTDEEGNLVVLPCVDEQGAMELAHLMEDKDIRSKTTALWLWWRLVEDGLAVGDLLQPKEFLERLFPSLQSPIGEVRRLSLRLVASLSSRDPRFAPILVEMGGVGALLDALSESTTPNSSTPIVEKGIPLPGKEGRPALHPAVLSRSKAPDVRREALRALCNIAASPSAATAARELGVVPMLCKLLQDRSTIGLVLRMDALRALGNMVAFDGPSVYEAQEHGVVDTLSGILEGSKGSFLHFALGVCANMASSSESARERMVNCVQPLLMLCRSQEPSDILVAALQALCNVTLGKAPCKEATQRGGMRVVWRCLSMNAEKRSALHQSICSYSLAVLLHLTLYDQSNVVRLRQAKIISVIVHCVKNASRDVARAALALLALLCCDEESVAMLNSVGAMGVTASSLLGEDDEDAKNWGAQVVCRLLTNQATKRRKRDTQKFTSRLAVAVDETEGDVLGVVAQALRSDDPPTRFSAANAVMELAKDDELRGEMCTLKLPSAYHAYVAAETEAQGRQARHAVRKAMRRDEEWIAKSKKEEEEEEEEAPTPLIDYSATPGEQMEARLALIESRLRALMIFWASAPPEHASQELLFCTEQVSAARRDVLGVPALHKRTTELDRALVELDQVLDAPVPLQREEPERPKEDTTTHVDRLAILVRDGDEDAATSALARMVEMVDGPGTVDAFLHNKTLGRLIKMMRLTPDAGEPDVIRSRDAILVFSRVVRLPQGEAAMRASGYMETVRQTTALLCRHLPEHVEEQQEIPAVQALLGVLNVIAAASSLSSDAKAALVKAGVPGAVFQVGCAMTHLRYDIAVHLASALAVLCTEKEAREAFVESGMACAKMVIKHLLDGGILAKKEGKGCALLVAASDTIRWLCGAAPARDLLYRAKGVVLLTKSMAISNESPCCEECSRSVASALASMASAKGLNGNIAKEAVTVSLTAMQTTHVACQRAAMRAVRVLLKHSGEARSTAVAVGGIPWITFVVESQDIKARTYGIAALQSLLTTEGAISEMRSTPRCVAAIQAIARGDHRDETATVRAAQRVLSRIGERK